MGQKHLSSHQQTRSNRRVLLGIFGIPILVFALSTALYYLVNSGVVDLGTVNNGKLVSPPLQLAELPLKRLDGRTFDYSEPEPKWTFLVIGGSRCTGECERMLYIARQSIVALGKKMNQVRLGYLSTSGAIGADLVTRFEQEYRGIEVFTVDAQSLSALFADAPAGPDQPRTFFVVDPDGWLMMFYQTTDTAQDTLNALGKAIVRDMKRLIK